MAVLIADPIAQPILDALRECLDDQLNYVHAKPASVCLRPGDRVDLLIAQGRDECCEGLGWVRLAAVYPTTTFPVPDESYSKCNTGWAVVAELGVARCAPVPEADELPTCADWTDVSHAVMADAAAMRRALMLFRRIDDYRHIPLVTGRWLPLTTEGGCVGGTMTTTVWAPYCDQLPTEEP
jgi:hypothetical protein